MSTSPRSGFSLVELSIVLVILGLLVGGILTGQALMRAAEIRKIATSSERINSGAHAFRDKYLGLPGDLKNATQFWGAIHGTQSTCIATASPDNKATCNGDGDGYVNKSMAYSDTGYERYHYWLHLANAGLIEGSYTGLTATTGAFGPATGVNQPETGVSNSSWYAASVNVDARNNAHPNYFARQYAYAMQLGLSANGQKILLPEEAWNIDSKLDDGSPVTGRVFSYKTTGTWHPNCTTSDTVTATYNMAVKDRVCNVDIGIQ
ncbi:MAG: hypothetical protein CMM93_05525 [Rickettsiales bacterium]|nr:hypothetical protein [Rickettsiales bacterium]|tara:strand:+ start:741 stop:1529 length:789 start_codon:yes stop_codon:yes gene_type:complete